MQACEVGYVLGRIGLGLASFGLAVTGVVVATDGAAPLLPTVTLEATAAVGCSAAGPYEVPAPGSVGVPAGLALCPSASVTITEPGAVLDGWDVRGGIVVDAPGVVVRRSRVTGDGATPYGIRTTPAGSVRIEDTTLTGDFPEAAVGDERWSGERIAITGVTHDGVRLGDGSRLRNSALSDFTPAPGAEPDAVVLHGTGDDVLVEDSRVEAGSVAGSAVRVATGTDGRDDGSVVIRGNVLGGGRYTVREDPPTGGLTDVRITGNRFHRDAAQAPLRVSPRAVLDDNMFLDGGLLPGR